MAYDKAVDSSKLNTALTATANAIRTKTGSSAQLNWNETTGFADDVGGIDISSQSKTVTPTAGGQTVTPDSGYKYLSQVTVAGDADLVAGNIAEGVSIFGVAGTLTAGSKVVTGTVTLSDKSLQTATVDGLGFTPSRVIIIGTRDSSSFYSTSGNQTLLAYDTQGPNAYAANRYSDGYFYYYGRSYVLDYSSISLIDGGFVINTTDKMRIPQYFQYTAIG